MLRFQYFILFFILGLWQTWSLKDWEHNPPRRPLNQQEKYILEDLNQNGAPKGRWFGTQLFGKNKGIKKPKCYFEDFTASCCVQMKYRTITNSTDSKGKPKVKPLFHKACFEAGINPTQLKIFVRAYYDTILLQNSTKQTHEIFNVKKYFGKLCWSLPQPIDALEICIWVYHVNISFNRDHPKAEMCLSFQVTSQLRMQLDCLRWQDGVFSLERIVDPPEPSVFTLHVSKKGFKFEVKIPNGIKKTWAKIKAAWAKTKELFKKSKDHITFLFKPADN